MTRYTIKVCDKKLALNANIYNALYQEWVFDAINLILYIMCNQYLRVAIKQYRAVYLSN